jgi:hypothetical protein
MPRQEQSFSIVGKDGVQKTYRILDAITIDDLALLGMKSVANEIRNGVPYESVLSREIRDYLVQSRVAIGG